MLQRLYIFINPTTGDVNCTHFIVICEKAVGDGDGRGTLDRVYEAIVAVGQRNMIDPDICSSVHGYSVAVALRPDPEVIYRVPDHPAASPFVVVNVNPVNDDVLHELDRDLSPVADMNVGSTPVYGLVAGHHQLLAQSYVHTAREDDPKRPRLDHCVS